jgi:uncharacterized metal-binding protein
LIFACSGAADVGAIADRAARQLMADGAGKMSCMAGIGAKIPAMIETTEAASKVLAIDGCQLDCAKVSLEQAGFAGFEHLRLTDMGMEKGQTAVTEERIQKVVAQGAAKLAQ